MDLELSDEDVQSGYFGGKSQHYSWINNLFVVKANRCKTSKHILLYERQGCSANS